MYAPFPLTDIHGRKDFVVNMRQEMITRRDYEKLVKTVEFTRTYDTDTWRVLHALS